jgi:hypothetical protein
MSIHLLSDWSYNYRTRALIMATMAQRELVPITREVAPLLGWEVCAFAAPELAAPFPFWAAEEAEEADVREALALALDPDPEAEAEAEADMDDVEVVALALALSSAVMVIAPDPVKVPSPIDLVVTGAEFPSELEYQGWLNASGIDMIFHPLDFPTGNAAMKASTSVSLISCSRELIPGDLDPSNQPVMVASTDSWV